MKIMNFSSPADNSSSKNEVIKAWKWVYAFLALIGILVAGGFLYVAQNIESHSVKAIVDDNATFPDFRFHTLKQQEFSFYGLASPIVIVNFWASWCSPCLEEIPSLIQLTEELKPSIYLVAISGDNNRQDLDVFLKAFPQFHAEYRILTWDNTRELRQLFSVGRFPETFIFDRDHRLRRHVVGAINWNDDDVKIFLKSLMK